MKTENQKLAEILEAKTGIFELIMNAQSNQRKDNLMGDTLIELVAKNAKSNVASIAKKEMESYKDPSLKVAQIIFKEIADNIEMYKNALADYNDSCKDDALEVLREIYPNRSDSELRKLIA